MLGLAKFDVVVMNGVGNRVLGKHGESERLGEETRV
jgi:hypothetical protein